MAALAALLLCAVSCSSSPAATPAPSNGGALTIGVWQSPSSFLDAGITAASATGYLIDAPVQEGLLWYRSTADTQRATSPAGYWTPDLATEVPTTANGDVRTSGCSTPHAAMCVTWKLRSGIRWHDGSTFSSHDVCDTFRFHWLDYGAKGKSNPTAHVTTAGWDQVLGCSEAGATTAVIDFATEYGAYLSLGSGVYGVMPASILDRALSQGTDLASMAVTLDLRRGSGNTQAFSGTTTVDATLDGTGPFVVQSAAPGKQLTLVANRNYWNSAAGPHLQRVVFVDQGDIATETTNVMSGAIQVGLDLRLGALTQLQHAAASGGAIFRLDTVPEPAAEKIDLNVCAASAGLCDNPKADESQYTADPVVRRALLMAIDRTTIMKTLTAGRSLVPRDAWMYLGASYLGTESIPATRFDRSGANALLDSSGYKRDPKCGTAPDGGAYRAWKDGSCLVVNLGTTSDDATRVMLESLVQADLQLAGIRVPAPFTPNLPAVRFFDAYADSGPLYTHAFDMADYALGTSLPGEPSTLAPSYHADCGGACPEENQIPSAGNAGAGDNVSGIRDAMLDAALDKGGATVDPAQRLAAYRQAQQRLATLIPEIPMYQQIAVNTFTTKLQGVSENELVWDDSIASWYCTGGSCQA